MEFKAAVRHRGWVLLAALVVVPPGQESLEEYQALAKILRPFLALVTWPGVNDRPLRVGVLGGAAFGTELDVALGRNTVGGRKVQIRYLSTTTFLSEAVDFDVLFLDRGEDARLTAILAKTKGKPILTLGYGEDLARRGVMVNFYLEGGRIRFEVNTNHLKDAGMSISSHLLKISKIVEG